MLPGPPLNGPARSAVIQPHRSRPAAAGPARRRSCNGRTARRRRPDDRAGSQSPASGSDSSTRHRGAACRPDRHASRSPRPSIRRRTADPTDAARAGRYRRAADTSWAGGWSPASGRPRGYRRSRYRDARSGHGARSAGRWRGADRSRRFPDRDRRDRAWASSWHDNVARRLGLLNGRIDHAPPYSVAE